MGDRDKVSEAFLAGYEDGWFDGRDDLVNRLCFVLQKEAFSWRDPTARTAFATAIRLALSLRKERTE